MVVCLACRTPFADEARFCPACGAPAPAGAVEGALRTGSILDAGWAQVVLGPSVGDGGMGTVYRSWLYYNPYGPNAGTPSHPVAVKVLHPSMSSRPYVRKLFMGEASAMQQLNHPNIVHFFAFLQVQQQLALVIEFIEGDSLDAVIARHAPAAIQQRVPCLPMIRAWHYFQQLLGALAATHALGIVHRDVKPANILIRRDGLAKLTDFGIARLPADVAQQGQGMQPGTGAYMSPEQVLGRELDGRSDLYSAAIVLFEMITGRTPFDDGVKSEMMIRHGQVQEVAPSITSLIPQAPPVIDMLFARALAKNPDHRFQHAIEFGNAFCQALGIPDTVGWKAQRQFAKMATGMVPQHMVSEDVRRKAATMPVSQADAEAIRLKLAGMYVG